MTIENVAEDKGEVYDVGHHEADTLIPEGRVEVEYVVQEEGAHLFSYRSFRHAAPVPCVSLCLGLQESDANAYDTWFSHGAAGRQRRLRKQVPRHGSSYRRVFLVRLARRERRRMSVLRRLRTHEKERNELSYSSR
jgi:hypothetical protein